MTLPDRSRDRSLVSERYETRRIIMEVSKRLAVVMKELGAFENYSGSAQRDYLNRIKWDCDPLDATQHVLVSNKRSHHGHKSKGMRNRLSFSNFGYADEGAFNWGKTRTYTDEIEDATDPTFARTFDLRKVSRGWEETLKAEVTLADSISRAYSKQVDLDMTATASASGGYMGVNVGLEVSTHMGVSENRTKEMGHSNSRTDSVQRLFVLEPGDYFSVSAEKQRVTKIAPYTVMGIRDFSILANFYDWTESRYLRGTSWDEHGKRIEFQDMRDLARWLNGYDVRSPNMGDFIDTCSRKCLDAIRWLEDPTNRMMTAEGEVERILDNNEDIVAEDL